MNILISKLDTCKFASCPDKMKSYGGFDVAALMILTLVKAYPQHTFYYIGSNDIAELSDHPANLIDIETPIRAINIKSKDKEKYEVAIDYCKQFNFDIALYWYCRYTAIAKYKDEYISKKGTPRLIRACEKSVSHIMSVPKEFNVPVYYMIDDVTELDKLPCDMPAPAAIWSQYSGTAKYVHYNNSTDKVIWEVPVTYKPIEKLWLLGKKKVDWRNFNKTNDFIITCNGPSNNKMDKLFYIENWVLSNFKDATVYGRWESPKTLVELLHKRGIADRFVKKGMCEMEDLMFNTKYTLVIPPSRKHPDFVTQKVFSMLYYGIIPFWCKNDYDCSNTKYSMFPDYIKVESPAELLYKIKELNDNKDMYRKLLDDLYSLLDDRYFDNRIVHDIFDEVLL